MTERVVRRMTREERRAGLLAAAARLVARRPQDRLTLEAIAAEAGVSPTLPYKYFPSVEDVALELYRATVDDIDTRTDEVLASDVPFDDKVRSVFLLWCSSVDRKDAPVVRLAEGSDAAKLARAVRRRRERAIGVWAAQIADEFGVVEGTARVVAASVTGGGSAVVQRVFAERLDRDAAADLLVALVRSQCEAARAHTI